MFEKLLQDHDHSPDEAGGLTLVMNGLLVLDALVQATAVLAIRRPDDMTDRRAFEAFRLLVEGKLDLDTAPDEIAARIRDLLDKRLAAIEHAAFDEHQASPARAVLKRRHLPGKRGARAQRCVGNHTSGPGLDGGACDGHRRSFNFSLAGSRAHGLASAIRSSAVRGRPSARAMTRIRA